MLDLSEFEQPLFQGEAIHGAGELFSTSLYVQFGSERIPPHPVGRPGRCVSVEKEWEAVFQHCFNSLPLTV